jgi:hypothetical protein
LTDDGIGLHVRAMDGQTLTFTKIGIGCGKAPSDVGKLKELRNPAMYCNIEKMEVEEDNISLTFYISNDEVTEGFQWTELGIYAKGADDVEVLYAYANARDKSSYIPPNTETFRYYGTYTATIYVGTTENVSATVKAAAYARLGDFEAHVENYENPHKVTKAQIGLGNVVNLDINDQRPTYTASKELEELKSREQLSVALGKLAKAVSELKAHIENQEIHVPADGALDVEAGGTGVSSYDDLAAALTNYNSVKNYIVAAPYKVSNIAPSDTKMLWIDTSSTTTGGLKYYNGNGWVHVPVAYT